MKRLLTFAVVLAALASAQMLHATRLVGVKTIDKDYIMVHFRDGEVRYRDDATGPSAYLGHTFVEGDDTLFVFGQRLSPEIAADPAGWVISSKDDQTFGTRNAVAAWRKSKPMNTDNTLTSELDHWIFLKLPKSMKQGCTYTVCIPEGLGSDVPQSSVTFDVWTSQSEAVHVNIIGYSPKEAVKAADLYLWLGDGGQRDYSAFEGNKVYLYNVDTGAKTKVGSVKFWKEASEHPNEAGEKNLTGSDVWTVDFKYSKPGRYRLVVDGVGCSMDFYISDDVYFEPYHYSLRGYYYMRLGEPIDPAITPVPRQPMFIPEVDPVGFTVYKTDMHPWHPDWRKLRGDVWDEPHFKPALQSEFWKHRLPGNPVNTEVRGGHSDAMDWDRHLAHVSNIYDLLLPYLLTGGRLSEDNLSIRESGNGIPDLIDEARNEVDFFLSAGIPNAVIHANGGDDLPHEERYARWVHYFTALCEYVKGTDLTFCLENLGSVPFTHRAENILQLINDCGGKNLGICLDTGHLHLTRIRDGNTQTTTEFVRMNNHIMNLAARLPHDKIRELQKQDGNPPHIYKILREYVLKDI